MEPTPTKTHRIVHLVTTNFQKIVAADITPNRNLITLAGKNESGKSSILNSILSVLRGKSALPEQPIRVGAAKSDTLADFGDFVAELKISPSTGARLVVKSKTGVEIKSPQTFLTGKSNEILTDVTGFIQLSKTPEGRRRQAELLRKLVGLDFTQLDADSQKAYYERTAVNRTAETARGKLANYPDDPTAPKQEVLVMYLMTELKTVQDHNAWNSKQRELLVADRQKVAQDRTELSELLKTIDDVKKMLAAKEEEYRINKAILEVEEKSIETRIAAIEGLVDQDEGPITTKISTADAANAKVRAMNRRREILEEIAQAEDKSAKFTDTVDHISKQKADQLAAAPFPLPGLSFNADGILLDGLPLTSGSTAQQMKAVLAIGFALKPEIPVAIIREGSMLDQDSLKELEAILEKYEAQCWLEDNRSTDPHAITIEEGEVVEK